jgi:hypothetical protein
MAKQFHPSASSDRVWDRAKLQKKSARDCEQQQHLQSGIGQQRHGALTTLMSQKRSNHDRVIPTSKFDSS